MLILVFEKAFPWLRLLATGLSPYMHGFDTRPFNVRFVVDKVAIS
jgi:hypothetical protein